MRNGALSILRAQQMIINSATSTINCLDVSTRNFGSPPGKGGAPENQFKRTGLVGTATFPSSIVSCSRASIPPGLGDQGSDTQDSTS